jgi:hypothetical protein
MEFKRLVRTHTKEETEDAANFAGVVCVLYWAGCAFFIGLMVLLLAPAVKAQEIQVEIAQPPVRFLTADTGQADKKIAPSAGEPIGDGSLLVVADAESKDLIVLEATTAKVIQSLKLSTFDKKPKWEAMARDKEADTPLNHLNDADIPFTMVAAVLVRGRGLPSCAPPAHRSGLAHAPACLRYPLLTSACREARGSPRAARLRVFARATRRPSSQGKPPHSPGVGAGASTPTHPRMEDFVGTGH